MKDVPFTQLRYPRDEMSWDSDASPERACLLTACRKAGLQPEDVMRLCAVVTGRDWQRTDATDIAVVARVLLQTAAGVAMTTAKGSRPCAR